MDVGSQAVEVFCLARDWRFLARAIAWGCALVSLGSCATGLMKKSESEKLDFSKDFDKVVKIKEFAPSEPNKTAPEGKAEKTAPTRTESASEKVAPKSSEAFSDKASSPARSGKLRNQRVKGSKKHAQTSNQGATHGSEQAVAKAKPMRRLPPLEDDEKMDGRRPLLDPFRVGEKVTLSVSYFKVAAGEMTLEVAPFVEVNGRKAYHFVYAAKSSSVFSMFYAVDDSAETFLDYLDLVPSSYAIHVRESKQLREVRAFWDFKQKTARLWEKKITREKGVQESNQDWPLEDYAQNVLTAAHYMRIFQMYPGKKLSFYVSDSGKNYLFRGEVLRREKLETPIGDLDTLVIKPQFELDGMFAPVGNILMWVTDDDRKFLVRIESSIRIGTIVAKLKALERGGGN